MNLAAIWNLMVEDFGAQCNEDTELEFYTPAEVLQWALDWLHSHDLLVDAA